MRRCGPLFDRAVLFYFRVLIGTDDNTVEFVRYGREHAERAIQMKILFRVDMFDDFRERVVQRTVLVFNRQGFYVLDEGFYQCINMRSFIRFDIWHITSITCCCGGLVILTTSINHPSLAGLICSAGRCWDA